MLRMVFEVVMVIAVVGGMVFMMKVSAKEDNFNKTLRDYGGDNEDGDKEDGDKEDGENDPKSP